MHYEIAKRAVAKLNFAQPFWVLFIIKHLLLLDVFSLLGDPHNEINRIGDIEQ